MIWAVAILFLIITILLLSGKGGFLIAGYNTASKAEKQKYDEKKLCRVMGCGMGIITIALLALAYFGNQPPKWLLFVLPVIIAATVVSMLILCNTACKVKNVNAADSEASAVENKRGRHVVTVTVIVVLAVCLGIGVMLFTGQIKTTVDENQITIDGSYWPDYTVALDSIKSVSYSESLDVGRRTNGMGSAKLAEGHFQNSLYGDYILYIYTKCDSNIVLDTSNGIVVLNAETKQETEDLYRLIENAVSQK